MLRNKQVHKDDVSIVLVTYNAIATLRYYNCVKLLLVEIGVHFSNCNKKCEKSRRAKKIIIISKSAKTEIWSTKFLYKFRLNLNTKFQYYHVNDKSFWLHFYLQNLTNAFDPNLISEADKPRKDTLSYNKATTQKSLLSYDLVRNGTIQILFPTGMKSALHWIPLNALALEASKSISSFSNLKDH